MINGLATESKEFNNPADAVKTGRPSTNNLSNTGSNNNTSGDLNNTGKDSGCKRSNTAHTLSPSTVTDLLKAAGQNFHQLLLWQLGPCDALSQLSSAKSGLQKSQLLSLTFISGCHREEADSQETNKQGLEHLDCF